MLLLKFHEPVSWMGSVTINVLSLVLSHRDTDVLSKPNVYGAIRIPNHASFIGQRKGNSSNALPVLVTEGRHTGVGLARIWV